MKYFIVTLYASVVLFSQNLLAIQCLGTSLTFDVVLDIVPIKNSDQFKFDLWLGDVEGEEPDINLSFNNSLSFQKGIVVNQKILKENLYPLKALSLTISGTEGYIEMIFAEPYDSSPESTHLDCRI